MNFQGSVASDLVHLSLNERKFCYLGTVVDGFRLLICFEPKAPGAEQQVCWLPVNLKTRSSLLSPCWAPLGTHFAALCASFLCGEVGVKVPPHWLIVKMKSSSRCEGSWNIGHFTDVCFIAVLKTFQWSQQFVSCQSVRLMSLDSSAWGSEKGKEGHFTSRELRP